TRSKRDWSSDVCSSDLSIYEYLIESSKPVTVKEIATIVGIHTNVARLHLTKLAEVKLIDSYINQEKSSGRPNRLYIPSEEAIEKIGRASCREREKHKQA